MGTALWLTRCPGELATTAAESSAPDEVCISGFGAENSSKGSMITANCIGNRTMMNDSGRHIQEMSNTFFLH